MTTPTQLSAPRYGNVLTPATLSWLVVGVLALGYMIVVAVRPAFLANYLPERVPSDPQSNEGQRAMSKALAEVQAMRDSIGQLQLDVAKVKTEVAGVAEREQKRETRLGQLEQKTDRVAGLAERAANMALTIVSEPTPGASSATFVPPAPKTVAATTDVKPVAKAIEKPVEISSVSVPKPVTTPAAPINFGPVTVKPAPVTFGVALAEGPSIDALRLSWSLIADKHAGTLKKLQPHYTTGEVGPDGPSYALIAGPIKSEADAKKICKALETTANPCRISTFSGEAL